MRRYHTGLRLIVAGATLLSTTACFIAPVAELQSAKLVGKGRFEITPGYTSMSFSDDGVSDHIQDHFGVQVATGLSDRFDLRGRVEHIIVESDDEDTDDISVTAIAIGPKFSLIRDKLAINLPFGAATGDGIDLGDTFQVHPTLLWTIPAHRNIEINTAVKGMIPITNSDVDELIAANIGLGLSSDLSKWAIRPEYGIVKNPGESGTISHFSVGLTLFLGKR